MSFVFVNYSANNLRCQPLRQQFVSTLLDGENDVLASFNPRATGSGGMKVSVSKIAFMPIRFIHLNSSDERYVRETRVFAICVVQLGVSEAFSI